MKKIFAIAAMLSLPLIAGCAEVVEEGNVGIEKRLGQMSKESLTPGFYWYNPLTTSIDEVDVQSAKWSAATETYTRDLQQATVKFSLNYHLNPKKAASVYSTVGDEWSNRIIPPLVTAKIKETFGKNPAVAVIANRQDAQNAILVAITEKLAAKNIIVDNFEITDVTFSSGFERAVEAKEVAVQNAQRSKNVTVQKEEEAKQVVITAKGEAEAMRVRAEALASNPKLVEYKAVETWDGKLPQYMMGDTMPFINIKK